MKPANFKKIYQSMNASELAVMTFESLVIGDSLTAKSIARSVPRHVYHSADQEYVVRLNHIFDVAALWSIEYWKCYCKMLASIGGGALKLTSKFERKSSFSDSLEQIWEGRLCALGLILLSLNTSHSINIDIMAKFADAYCIYGIDMTIEDLSYDAHEYYRNYLAYFEALIDGSSVPESVAEYLGWDSY